MRDLRQALNAVAALLLAGVAVGLTILFGFVGLGLVGLATLLICTVLELEQDGALGSEFTPELYARQLRTREQEPVGARLAHEQQRSAMLRAVRPFRWAGALLLATAVIGFLAFQS